MKNIKQRFITTGAMTLALAMGAMTTVPVFGVNGDTNTAGYVPVTKTVNKQQGVAIPQTNVTFNVDPETVAAGTTNNGVPVLSGIAGAFPTSFDITPDAPTTTNSDQTSVTYTNRYDLRVTNPGVFKAAGIYRYKLTEAAPVYKGFAPTPNTVSAYYVDVYVINTANGLAIDDLLVWKEGATDIGGKANEAAFQNTYTTHKLTVNKQITGNNADLTATFPFTVTINSDQVGDIYYIVTKSGNTVLKTTTLTTASTSTPLTTTVDLGQNQVVEVYGLSDGDTYTVAENADASTGKGYTVGIAQNPNTATGDTIDLNKL